MKRVLGRFSLCSIALLALVLAGHSECRALGDPTATVPSQVAAAVHLQQWSQVLWGLVTSQTGAQPPSFGQPISNPDGSVTQSFVTADGTEVVLTTFSDGSARMDIFFVDGTIQTVLQSVPIFDGVSKTTIDWSVTSSDGLSVHYTSVVDDRGTPFDISDDITQLDGSSVLPGGATQTFSVLTAGGQTEVQSSQSDGSTFALQVPLALPDFTAPDFSQEASGTYADSSLTMDFTLASTPIYPFRWAALLSDVGDGLTGTFSLNSDFSGSGQLEESDPWGQTLEALVSWTQSGESQVYSLTGQDLHMGPAGAALDFLEHRWETLTALMAPAPGVSMMYHRPRWFPSGPRPRVNRPRLPGVLHSAMQPLSRAGAYVSPPQWSLAAESPIPTSGIDH
jgi:hypothetical protein